MNAVNASNISMHLKHCYIGYSLPGLHSQNHFGGVGNFEHSSHWFIAVGYLYSANV